ncbi:MAG: UDP-N-acetylglucosamine 2-epimerase (hydrolyzing), partial [Planctomycetes bacterium]|nr:UDP-N-acetylglucosamine 2-epimerase (hydrolyzing) [Planctomycetota bacterium]
LEAIRNAPKLQLHLIAAGGHLTPTFGWTVDELAAQGFPPDERVDLLLSADTPEGIAKSLGLGVIGFADVYRRMRPDLLVVLGDRFDMFAAAAAAAPFKIPIAHIHGGEVTTGAMDEGFRHGMTKLSHLHFASTKEHAARIVQLGEEPWRVTVSGAPGLDHLKQATLLSRSALEERLGLALNPPPLLVTFHPVTLQYEQTEYHIEELLAALDEFDLPIVITKPNADTSGQAVIRRIEEFARTRPRVRVADNLGTQAYFSLMGQAAAMLGNSSSGIIEAASFALPVVNVGIRQEGRPRSANVIDTGHDRREVAAAVSRALSVDFRSRLHGMENVYGSGEAAPRIVERLTIEPLNERLLLKQFHNLDGATANARREAA